MASATPITSLWEISGCEIYALAQTVQRESTLVGGWVDEKVAMKLGLKNGEGVALCPRQAY